MPTATESGPDRAHESATPSPPSTLQEFLEEEPTELSRAGKISTPGPADRLRRAPRDGLSLAKRHREMVVLLFPPMPPRFVQRLLFGRK